MHKKNEKLRLGLPAHDGPVNHSAAAPAPTPHAPGRPDDGGTRSDDPAPVPPHRPTRSSRSSNNTRGRNALPQCHLDLKNHFYAQVRARGQMPDSEIRLRKQLVKPKELRAKDATQLTQMRADVDHLPRAVNQLPVENRQLRGAL